MMRCAKRLVLFLLVAAFLPVAFGDAQSNLQIARSNAEFRVDRTGIAVAPPIEPTTHAGTIVFWVQPDFAPDDERSHTFLSARWSGDDDSYLVVTDGWWEPAGAGLLYFVLSNEDQVHCSTRYDLPRGEWSMVAVAWSPGRCEIYIDAVPRVSIAAQRPRQRELSQVLLGADTATPIARQRTAPGRYARLRIFDVALNAEQLTQLFDQDGLGGVTAADSDWRWLDRYSAAALPANAPTIPKRRAIFDEGHHWGTTREETDKRLSRIARAGFNMYVPTIWYGRGTYYPSQVAHQDPALEQVLRGDDPVAYLIRRAHERGIEVHGSFVVAKRQDEQLPTFFGPGVPPMAYDVHNPQFRDFIVNLVADAARRYELDGINLDYIRAIGICTSPDCRRSYADATGRNLAADSLVRYTSDTAARAISDWQRAAIHDIVLRIRHRLNELGRPIALSVCFNSIEDFPFSLEGRDAVGWINEGLVDFAFDMQYVKRLDIDGIERYRRQLTSPDRQIVLLANWDRTGDAVAARTPARLRQLAEFSIRRWPSGFALYLYNQLDDRQIDALGSVLAPRAPLNASDGDSHVAFQTKDPSASEPRRP